MLELRGATGKYTGVLKAPLEARQKGIAMVFQETRLVPCRR
ncbi:hypothetical protein [Variovorax rhizosphaerae]|uniref:Uncharacterized protein n=1 Tax=Variovorax rhizosphaerae TaxID=1836200 RepID=A0ABU8WVD7_9BURK